MQRLGLPVDDNTVMDANQAAIALAMAMNQARMELADREGIKTESQSYGAARLEALRRKLAPLYAAIPRDIELFDLGLVAQEKPRLFVDIIAFVEMNRDQTAFRFVQETRSGRVTLAETGDDTAIIDHVTQYIARRLVERERALAQDIPPRLRQPMPLEASEALPAAGVAEPDLPHSAVDLPAQTPEPAAPSSPMTAAEAFRQWTRPPQDVQLPPAPLLPKATGSAIASDAGLAQAASVPQAIAEAGKATIDSTVAQVQPLAEVLPRLDEAPKVLEPVVSASNVVVAAETPSNVSSPAIKAAIATTAIASAAAASATARRSMPETAGGWWIWPVLALLIGIGLGALALYLYAASITR